MAIDNTPPRLRLIVTIAIIVIITLFSLDFVFKSYFAFMTDEAKHEKIAPKTDLLAQLLAEHEALASAKIPVEQAMAQVAKGTRPELIEPKASDDLTPMTGWSKMPRPAPVPAPGADTHAPLPAPATDTHADGGLAADAGPVDAGAMPTTIDAGATRAPGAIKDAGVHAPH